MVAANDANELGSISELAFRKLDKKYRKAILRDAVRLPSPLREAVRSIFAELSHKRA
jgi:hypothetical protein